MLRTAKSAKGVKVGMCKDWKIISKTMPQKMCAAAGCRGNQRKLIKGKKLNDMDMFFNEISAFPTMLPVAAPPVSVLTGRPQR